MKILVIEDEAGMLHSITAYFAKSGYVCEVATTFAEAEEKIHLYEYDCVILDITLPDGNGLDILEQLKKRKSQAGIIILSAKNSLDDRVKGLTLGADDYLPKPFHLTELNARVVAILRRLKFDGSNEVTIGNIILNLDTKKVYVDKEELILKKKEYELLLFFISNKTRIISKTSLAEHIWGDNADRADSFDFLYSQIKNLRKRLLEYKANYNIEAIYGIGYKFVNV
ncbi:response regulator transcription factor [Cytophaga aurantiaca]|uniref:response regulator transcription factor n=1 Tax=Cytophaga aurantiaca TaxID=29530 RepID=UPI0003654C11|nr:response regulator transcription factor [Cytophaga aurantiaca]